MPTEYDISFKDTLIPKTNEEKTITSNILIVFQENTKGSDIVEKILNNDKIHFNYSFNDPKSKPFKPDYKYILRSIIDRNNHNRFCKLVGESAIFSNFNKPNVIIILTYTTLDSKNYITGFATLNVSEGSIDFLCTDLQYSGIGSNLMTFIKLFVVNVLNKNTIYLQSIRDNRTRNFYIGQFFKEDPHTSDNFSWTYNPDNLEEDFWYQNFHIPFKVEKNSELKYTSREEPDRKSPRQVFKPYTRATSFVYENELPKTTGGTKKRKRCIKRRTRKKKNT
jgi:hypothetical protein